VPRSPYTTDKISVQRIYNIPLTSTLRMNTLSAIVGIAAATNKAGSSDGTRILDLVWGLQ
jgi:hypothetical protein